ncbi:right-handed parallel beta-helix repeat-containing protein [Pedobacter cryophilus]|uniref:Right-handed parallel beta-helix repeat-containing protein n=1 Tax=Pedobacter cryophilus TaxID=2571271 RepID=A0A4U1C4A9_9SPHI|nr:right-handed parallel beta-helix repeat-containing protein [Pedobacter cryophilus]TKB99196.1 right-handed parallel beta-helix repeat-containing protein [Pedobacter cryophilus]
MKKKTVLFLVCMFNLTVYSTTSCKKSAETVAQNNNRKGSNFYVDSENGNDSYSGKTTSKAWKTLNKVNNYLFTPGDSILLKSGGIWNGQLIAKGSGSSGYPIVVSSYGGNTKPLLDGKGLVEQVVKLEDVDYWELHHLEITNNATSIGKRLGVLIKDNGKERKHFHLKNLYIHDIMGDYSFEMQGKNTGGIGIIGNAATKFDDILIEDCEIANVTRVGIYSNLTDGKAAVKGNRPITNFVIRRNKIHHCAGDGVIVRYAYQPLIEYNEVWENHNASEDLVKYGVALWCRSTDEATFQYNEVYNTRGGKDGQAFDADEDAYRTIIQNNYSHDNEGGFVLITSTSEDAIVRNNISVNDGIKGLHIFDFPVWANHIRGTGIFHNNTIVLGKSHETVVVVDEALNTAKFYNNIFYHAGEGELYIKSGGMTAIFNSNSYFGYDPFVINDVKSIVANPMLLDPLNYKIGKNFTNGFKINALSPVKGKGINILQMEGNYWLPNLGLKDFFGNSFNSQNISLGANQIN